MSAELLRMFRDYRLVKVREGEGCADTVVLEKRDGLDALGEIRWLMVLRTSVRDHAPLFVEPDPRSQGMLLANVVRELARAMVEEVGQDEAKWRSSYQAELAARIALKEELAASERLRAETQAKLEAAERKYAVECKEHHVTQTKLDEARTVNRERWRDAHRTQGELGPMQVVELTTSAAMVRAMRNEHWGRVKRALGTRPHHVGCPVAGAGFGLMTVAADSPCWCGAEKEQTE